MASHEQAEQHIRHVHANHLALFISWSLCPTVCDLSLRHCCCLAAASTSNTFAAVAQVEMGNYSMYVYASNDFVSKELAGPRHSYEEKEVAAVLWAMQQHGAAQRRTAKAAPLAEQPLFVDAGANVGSFAFAVADAGYRVAAFEGKADVEVRCMALMPALHVHAAWMQQCQPCPVSGLVK